MSKYIAFAPSELTFSVGASAVFAVENVTVIVTPLVNANVLSEQDTTFAAVPVAVLDVPVNAFNPLRAVLAVFFAVLAVLSAVSAVD